MIQRIREEYVNNGVSNAVNALRQCVICCTTSNLQDTLNCTGLVFSIVFPLPHLRFLMSLREAIRLNLYNLVTSNLSRELLI